VPHRLVKYSDVGRGALCESPHDRACSNQSGLSGSGCTAVGPMVCEPSHSAAARQWPYWGSQLTLLVFPTMPLVSSGVPGGGGEGQWWPGAYAVGRAVRGHGQRAAGYPKGSQVCMLRAAMRAYEPGWVQGLSCLFCLWSLIASVGCALVIGLRARASIHGWPHRKE